ncbi:MAG: thioredoxin family protein [Planctomycetaceae bacterium]|nr:thioredoxin family protein [Planctomycetaceae bacterium]
MFWNRLIAVVLVSFVWIQTVDAGKYNPVLTIGDAAPSWKDLPGTDGQKHALADLKDKPIVVVVFTCNSCPYAVDYEERLVALAKKHAGATGQVAVVAINVNKVAEDSLPEMKKRAAARGFTFPYVFDESQQIARDFGATFTPEFFVLDQARKIAYMGALDDQSDAAKVTVNYVDQAIAALLKGEQPATTETVARGCLVRYARQRKK